jgi:membrane protease YdiL (CAAX protease family)
VTDNLTPTDVPTSGDIKTFLPAGAAVRWGWSDVFLGLGAFILSLVLAAFVISLVGVDVDDVDAVGIFSFATAILGYAVIVAVVVLASRRKGLGTLGADFGLRFRPVDVAIGLGVGILAKIVSAAIGAVAITVTGHAPETGNFDLSTSPLWIVLNGFVVAVLIAPVVEELFFRGLVLRAANNRVLRRGGTAKRAAMTATVASALGFALLHLYQSPDVTLLIILGGTTFFLGFINARVTLATGRLGAAIIAHAFFNGSSVVLVLLAGSGS